MSYYTPDVYHQAEQFGLTQIGQIEWAEPDYSFDIGVVWIDENGDLFYAQDAGCSCPSPFEDYTSKESLEKLTFAELQARLEKEAEEHYISEWNTFGPTRDDLRARVVDLLAKARSAQKGV